MSLKTYLVGIIISTILCWTAFLLTVLNIDPFTADYAGITSFFVSFFLGIFGLIMLILIYIYSRLYTSAVLYEKMPTLIRQSLLLSFLITAMLGMQAMRVLRWWTGSMLIIIILLIEISFYSDRLRAALDQQDQSSTTQTEEK